MTVEEQLNEKIAKMLGFKKYSIKNGVKAWEYPKEWKDEITSSPMMCIPDFLKMIKQNRDISKMFCYGIPNQHLSSTEN